MDDGIVSAEISVICGNKPLTFLNSLMVRKFYGPFAIKRLRTLEKESLPNPFNALAARNNAISKSLLTKKTLQHSC